MRLKGLTYQSICDVLNAASVPTPGGGTRWWPSHVNRLMNTHDALDVMESQGR